MSHFGNSSISNPPPAKPLRLLKGSGDDLSFLARKHFLIKVCTFFRRNAITHLIDYVPAKSLQSCLTLCDPWTIAHQAPLSMGFSRQEYWSGLPFPPPGDRPSPGIKLMSPVSPALQVDSLPAEPSGKPLFSLKSSI